MPATIADIEIGDAWVDLNTTSGIAVGSEFTIQNKRSTWILLHESTSQPSANETSGVYLTNLDRPDGKGKVVTGSLKIWAKSTKAGVTALINIQGA
jgi:hypothetical protein